MKLYHSYKDIPPDWAPTGSVINIGNFDGVHIGHLDILKKGLKLAQSNGLSHAVCTFEPHPYSLLKPKGAMQRLTYPEQKYKLLASCGVHTILSQKFDANFAALSSLEFAKTVLSAALHAKYVIVGNNFKFGKNRKGDISTLKKLGTQLNFNVTESLLITQNGSAVSSSRIRKLIMEGNVEDAALLLGRHYSIHGRVIRGHGTASKQGFPTVNLKTENILIPSNGIYAAYCILENKKTVLCAAYTGDRPTHGHGPTLEAHLLDFNGDLYSTELELVFVKRIRNDIKFDSQDKLSLQIKKDVQTIRKVLENLNVP
jgi:riboflavin kinase/FMN adenylyltransferase